MRNLHACIVVSALVFCGLPLPSQAAISIGVSINVAPPVLPVYTQPPPPAVGYLWTPGYWAWQNGDYYWIPGTWVLAPEPGLLWTPGYWGWVNGGYFWHQGYWGPHVGFYGGVAYGFGYGGSGYQGGYWRGHDFYYNRAVNNVSNVHITNVYNKPVINNFGPSRVSFNGGNGGTAARPTARELSAQREHHFPLTASQTQHEQGAFHNQSLRASVNGGRPAIAATQKPAVFSGKGVIAARDSAPPPPRHGPPARSMNRPPMGGAQMRPEPRQLQEAPHPRPQGPQNRPLQERPRPNEEHRDEHHDR